MEQLYDIFAVVGTCLDLSVSMEMGETYPTLWFRQGPGFYQCMGLLEQVMPFVLIGMPFFILGWATHRATSSIMGRRRLRRIR